VGLGYDPQGNLHNKNGQIYEFDYGNRLRGVTDKEYYRYDGHGRRVLNWRNTNNTVTVSQYSQSGQVMYQDDSTQGASENIYLAGSLIAIRNGGGVKYQHTDALGSPVAVTNEAGAVIERNDYEPYGAIIGKPNYNGIGYTGHVMDGATGLTYMQQRYYDQSLGRFLSVDPVTANSNNGVNFNRYKYALNNPYRFTDPDGRCESISTCQMMRDDIDLTEGRMSLEEHQERINARGMGAVVGVGILATVYTGGRAAPVFGGILKRVTSRSMSGPARQALGEIREQLVAELTGGIVSGEQVSVPGLGGTDIDVVARNGDLVAVGGGAKARDKGNLGRALRIYQAVAKQRGVGVRAFFAKGTPKEITDYARKILGKDNVSIFKDRK
jgi:RHS repeat-associated protein